jgi:hypothetical protein
MFYIAIGLIPIGFIADTFQTDRFCSDRFQTDTFYSDTFCLGAGNSVWKENLLVFFYIAICGLIALLVLTFKNLSCKILAYTVSTTVLQKIFKMCK